MICWSHNFRVFTEILQRRRCFFVASTLPAAVHVTEKDLLFCLLYCSRECRSYDFIFPENTHTKKEKNNPPWRLRCCSFYSRELSTGAKMRRGILAPVLNLRPVEATLTPILSHETHTKTHRKGIDRDAGHRGRRSCMRTWSTAPFLLRIIELLGSSKLPEIAKKIHQQTSSTKLWKKWVSKWWVSRTTCPKENRRGWFQNTRHGWKESAPRLVFRC
jgi:hypothetical protein